MAAREFVRTRFEAATEGRPYVSPAKGASGSDLNDYEKASRDSSDPGDHSPERKDGSRRPLAE